MQRKHGSYERSINEIACGGTRELFVFLYISYRVSEKKMAMSVRLKPWRQFKDLFFRKSNLNIGDRGNFESPKTAYTSGPSLIGINKSALLKMFPLQSSFFNLTVLMLIISICQFALSGATPFYWNLGGLHKS